MILYIQTAFLGDALLGIPTLKFLKKKYPGQMIHLLCRKGLGSFFKDMGVVDEYIEPKENTKFSLKEAYRVFRSKEYQLLICPHESVRSSLLSFMVSSKKKLGHKNFLNNLIYTQTSQRPMYLPEALRQLSLVKTLDADLSRQLEALRERAPFEKIPAWSSMACMSHLDRSLLKKELSSLFEISPERPWVSLAPGSVWPTKKWGEERFRQLSQKLEKEGFQVVLIGAKSERALADQVAQDCSAAKNLAGKTSLLELAKILRASRVAVTNDSGSMHMSSLAETPCVSFFGPTVLSFGYQPWSESTRVLENKELTCRPCSSHGTKSCPIGTHECMTSISVDQAFEACLQVANNT